MQAQRVLSDELCQTREGSAKHRAHTVVSPQVDYDEIALSRRFALWHPMPGLDFPMRRRASHQGARRRRGTVRAARSTNTPGSMAVHRPRHRRRLTPSPARGPGQRHGSRIHGKRSSGEISVLHRNPLPGCVENTSRRPGVSAVANTVLEASAQPKDSQSDHRLVHAPDRRRGAYHAMINAGQGRSPLHLLQKPFRGTDSARL